MFTIKEILLLKKKHINKWKIKQKLSLIGIILKSFASCFAFVSRPDNIVGITSLEIISESIISRYI